MRINHNIAALNTYRQLSLNNSNLQKSLEKLSSGYRINRAGDDAAGLSISEKMRGQIRGLQMAQKNAQDGISLIQTAEGALTETHSILQRMRELVVQAGNTGTNQPEDLKAIQDEINQLISEVNGIATRTQFNGKQLLDGTVGTFDFQIGANQNQKLTLTINDMQASNLGVDANGDGAVDDTSQALDSIDVTDFSTTPFDTQLGIIDGAIQMVSAQRSALGAVQNRLEHTINNLGAAEENLTAAESRIRDVDMAKEMMEFTKNSILTQAAQAMLAQANQVPQGVLQLLR